MRPIPHAQPPKPAEAIVRFCLSCVATIACWCVWLVLGALLALQIYVIAARELPVPTFVLAGIESRLTRENLAASFARAQFDPTGRLLLEAPRIRLLQYEDALLVADSLYVRKSPWSILSGARAPDEIRLDRATLQLPAPLSPTGTALPLLQEATATLRIDGNIVHVDQLAFRLGRLAVMIRGDYQLAARGDEERPPLGVAIGKALQLGRQVARELAQLDVVERPFVFVNLSVRPGIGNVAELELTADALREPRDLPLETGPLRATTIVRLDGDDERPLRLAFATERLIYRDRLDATIVHGTLATRFAPRNLTVPDDVLLDVSAARVDAVDLHFIAPDLSVRWQREHPLTFTLGVEVHREPMSFAGRIDLAQRAAQLDFEGVVPPSLVTATLPRYIPRIAPYLHTLDPVRVVATADFAAGWKFTELRTRVRAGRLDSNGVPVTSARGRIDVDRAGNFLAHEAVATLGANYARGSYWMNFRSWNYRFLLEGELQPPAIAGWFRSGWWLNFWETIRFTGDAPVADVDVLGNWRDANQTSYFGSTEARSAVVLGADFESAHARVFVRPQFAHAFDLRVARAGGAQKASGWFKRIADAQTRELRAFEFDLTGNLDPDSLRHLGGPAAESLLEPWEFQAPPALTLVGRLDYPNGRASPALTFRGETASRAVYEGFPLESIRAEGGVSGSDVRLDKIELAVAGGRGTAKAAMSGEDERKRLGFDFYVEAADLVQAIRAINEFEKARTSAGELPTSPNAELLKRASGGRLNFALSAQGHPSDLATFNGSGNLEIVGAELGEVHLFGLLSQLLSGLSLNFSSLKLDTLRGSYRVADGRVNFPDIKVTGPTALIEGRGDFRLLDKTLDFTARFRPYEENRNLLTGVIGIVMNPLASILELRLTGPIHKPNWSVSLGSSAPKEAPLPPQPGSAGAADPATPAPAEAGPTRR